jgi:hypothetical protein
MLFVAATAFGNTEIIKSTADARAFENRPLLRINGRYSPVEIDRAPYGETARTYGTMIEEASLLVPECNCSYSRK